jgi:hypothetical protein
LFSGLALLRGNARENLHAFAGDTKGVQPRLRRAPAYLHRAQLAHRGVAFDVIRQPQNAVGHGKNRMSPLFLGVLAE